MILVEKRRKVKTINVANFINEDNRIADDEDGQRVYELIKRAFSENRKVVLSFRDVGCLGPVFFNTAIGQLYKDYSDEEIKENLRIENIEASDNWLLKHATDMANLYYNDPEKFHELQKIFDKILYD
jgi:YesN/AraC family two-component response regulator